LTYKFSAFSTAK